MKCFIGESIYGSGRKTKSIYGNIRSLLRKRLEYLMFRFLKIISAREADTTEKETYYDNVRNNLT